MELHPGQQRNVTAEAETNMLLFTDSGYDVDYDNIITRRMVEVAILATSDFTDCRDAGIQPVERPMPAPPCCKARVIHPISSGHAPMAFAVRTAHASECRV